MSNIGPQCNAPSARCHPIYKSIYLLCRAEDMTIAELARRAGVGKHTIEEGLRGNQLNPMIATLESCLAVFGYGLKLSPLVQQPVISNKEPFSHVRPRVHIKDNSQKRRQAFNHD